ncbi:MAG TPA: hypothetical protein VK609_22865, partial [Mucilaginibacter sp.]|nr:hypothetical protein [Mucilaginibacter sp.]
QAWYESGPIKNVVIRNNNFKNFGLHGGTSPLIQITPDLKPDKDFYYHSNILVENNTCEVFSCPLVIAKSVEGFRFVGNRIKTSNDYPINPKGTRNFLFESCRDILIQNNIADRDWPGTKIKGVEAMLKYYKQ